MKKLKVKGHNITILSDNTIRIEWKNGKQPQDRVKQVEIIFDYLEAEGFIESEKTA